MDDGWRLPLLHLWMPLLAGFVCFRAEMDTRHTMEMEGLLSKPVQQGQPPYEAPSATTTTSSSPSAFGRVTPIRWQLSDNGGSRPPSLPTDSLHLPRQALEVESQHTSGASDQPVLESFMRLADLPGISLAAKEVLASMPDVGAVDSATLLELSRSGVETPHTHSDSSGRGAWREEEGEEEEEEVKEGGSSSSDTRQFMEGSGPLRRQMDAAVLKALAKDTGLEWVPPAATHRSSESFSQLSDEDRRFEQSVEAELQELDNEISSFMSSSSKLRGFTV